MHLHIRKLILFLVFGHFAFATESVSPEERKAEFAKPRGLSNSSSSHSNSSSSASVAQPSSNNNSANDVFQKMGDGFQKEMNKLTKDFSLPKPSEEPNYLKELEEARKTLASTKDETGNSKASLIAQYTEVFIETLNELTQIQIDYEVSETKRLLKSRVTPGPQVNENHLNPSPISLRTPLSSPSGNSRGLFPSTLDALNANAYNPPK